MVKKQDTVYIGMSADLIHKGHLNIINEGFKYGKVVVGLLTDEAIASYKRLPLISYNERKLIIENSEEDTLTIPVYASKDIKKVNFFKSLFLSFNYMIWGDA